MLGIGFLITFGIAANGWLDNQSETESLQSSEAIYVKQEITSSTLEDILNNDNSDIQTSNQSGDIEESKIISEKDKEVNENSEGNTEVSDAIEEVDPNRILKNGLTMRESRQLIDELADIWKEQGVPQDEIRRRLELAVEDWGTTLKTLESVDIKVSSNTGSAVNQNSGNTKSNNGNINTGNNSISGDYDDLPDWMKEMTVDGGYVPDISGMKNPFISDSNTSSGALEFKSDKWFTKEEKEAARQRAIERGDTDFEQRAKEWEEMPDWMKDCMIGPYHELIVPDTSGWENPFK